MSQAHVQGNRTVSCIANPLPNPLPNPLHPLPNALPNALPNPQDNNASWMHPEGVMSLGSHPRCQEHQATAAPQAPQKRSPGWTDWPH